MHAVLLEWLPGFWPPASLRQSFLEISITPVPSFPLMESGEVAGTVNLDSFTLDFMERDPNEGAWDEEGERILDNEDVLAQMLGAIPSTTVSTRRIETSWIKYDHSDERLPPRYPAAGPGPL